MRQKREYKRAILREAKKRYKLPPGKLTPIDLEVNDHPEWMTRAFSNNRYTVMINDNAKTDKGEAIRVMIQRLDNTPIPNHWSEIQKIKNELFGNKAVGVEYFPAESELTDDYNIYWLWVFKDGILPKPY